MNHLQDPSGVVRSKCVRTIGKMAKNRYLEPYQVEVATEAIASMIGNGVGDSDPMYLVRKEAAQALAELREVGG